MSAGHGIERNYLCGNPEHNDHNASAWVNSLSGLFICFSCGYAGRVDPERIEILPAAVVKELERFTRAIEEPQRVYAESWLNQFDSTGPGDYWLGRYDAATCAQFRLGQTVDGTAATIPMRDLTGRVLGVIRRDLTGVEEPKYSYPKAIPIGHLLFGYHASVRDIVVLTEGATDAMAAWEAGYDAWAVYGSRSSAPQRRALYRYAPRLILGAFDMDTAGERASSAWAWALSDMPYVRVKWDGGKDLASLSVAARRVALDQAVQSASGVARIRISRVGSGHADRTDAR